MVDERDVVGPDYEEMYSAAMKEVHRLTKELTEVLDENTRLGEQVDTTVLRESQTAVELDSKVASLQQENAKLKQIAEQLAQTINAVRCVIR